MSDGVPMATAANPRSIQIIVIRFLLAAHHKVFTDFSRLDL
jgi:hypothetical protein